MKNQQLIMNMHDFRYIQENKLNSWVLDDREKILINSVIVIKEYVTRKNYEGETKKVLTGNQMEIKIKSKFRADVKGLSPYYSIYHFVIN